MAKLNGSAVRINVLGIPVAASTSCELTIDSETIGTAGRDQGAAEESLSGLKGWKISLDSYYLLTQGTVMAKLLIDGTRLDIDFKLGSKHYYGYAYVSDYSATGTKDRKVTTRLTLQGTGILSNSQLEIGTLDNTVYSAYKVAGHEMILGVGGTRVALLTNTTLNMYRTLREIAPSSDGWRQYLPGRYSWSLSADALIDGTTPNSGMVALSMGSQLDAVMRIGLDKYEGKILITNKAMSGPLKTKATCRISADGSGKISVVNPESSYFDYEFGITF